MFVGYEITFYCVYKLGILPSRLGELDNYSAIFNNEILSKATQMEILLSLKCLF